MLAQDGAADRPLVLHRPAHGAGRNGAAPAGQRWQALQHAQRRARQHPCRRPWKRCKPRSPRRTPLIESSSSDRSTRWVASWRTGCPAFTPNISRAEPHQATGFMAFFKFRKAGDESAAAPPPAREHRGHAQARQAPADRRGRAGADRRGRFPAAVRHPAAPDRGRHSRSRFPTATRPSRWRSPASPRRQSPAVSGPVTAAAGAGQSLGRGSAGRRPPDAAAAAAAPEAKAEAAPAVKAEAEARTQTRAEAAPGRAGGRGAEGQGPARRQAGHCGGSAGEGRFVVQVGAFADAAKAREARAKVERAGLKTYTHVAETKDGKRIRVRVGPFDTRGRGGQGGRARSRDWICRPPSSPCRWASAWRRSTGSFWPCWPRRCCWAHGAGWCTRCCRW